MFNRNRETQDTAELSNASTQIMKGTTIEGNIDTFGNLRIEGKVVGNIKSKTKVALGESSYIEGNIAAQNAEIAGEVKGTIDVSDILSLKATANIMWGGTKLDERLGWKFPVWTVGLLLAAVAGSLIGLVRSLPKN